MNRPLLPWQGHPCRRRCAGGTCDDGEGAELEPAREPARGEPALPPSAEFAAQANARGELSLWSDADRVGFWADQARHLLDWDTPFTQVLDWSDAPVARWFADGRLNAGKIMRRLLRDVAEHRVVGDVTTLADSAVMDLIAAGLAGPGAST